MKNRLLAAALATTLAGPMLETREAIADTCTLEKIENGIKTTKPCDPNVIRSAPQTIQEWEVELQRIGVSAEAQGFFRTINAEGDYLPASQMLREELGLLRESAAAFGGDFKSDAELSIREIYAIRHKINRR